jgi:hypothetical protein
VLGSGRQCRVEASRCVPVWSVQSPSVENMGPHVEDEVRRLRMGNEFLKMAAVFARAHQ